MHVPAIIQAEAAMANLAIDMRHDVIRRVQAWLDDERVPAERKPHHLRTIAMHQRVIAEAMGKV